VVPILLIFLKVIWRKPDKPDTNQVCLLRSCNKAR